MSQQDPVHGDTSDRLFTAEDLERFARQQLEENREPTIPVVQGDPLTDPIPGFQSAAHPTSPPPTSPPPASAPLPQLAPHCRPHRRPRRRSPGGS